ncbi:hypothetical protein BD309DRAFT_988584 [Dichomitus squalens]|uniref:Uncharacterized protein n=1 Tax=Dichomitus squalens TaxID=114155 RepID=A0A4Q9Q0K7_9APHY|nr:hypothetical protein BD309DRAFT_988584 [Dichomitus squalens]TBU60490.1 hypothetical protein BD310DRAFT_947237 [Dichomitus squalens]
MESAEMTYVEPWHRSSLASDSMHGKDKVLITAMRGIKDWTWTVEMRRRYREGSIRRVTDAGAVDTARGLPGLSSSTCQILKHNVWAVEAYIHVSLQSDVYLRSLSDSLAMCGKSSVGRILPGVHLAILGMIVLRGTEDVLLQLPATGIVRPAVACRQGHGPRELVALPAFDRLAVDCPLISPARRVLLELLSWSSARTFPPHAAFSRAGIVCIGPLERAMVASIGTENWSSWAKPMHLIAAAVLEWRTRAEKCNAELDADWSLRFPYEDSQIESREPQREDVSGAVSGTLVHGSDAASLGTYGIASSTVDEFEVGVHPREVRLPRGGSWQFRKRSDRDIAPEDDSFRFKHAAQHSIGHEAIVGGRNILAFWRPAGSQRSSLPIIAAGSQGWDSSGGNHTANTAESLVERPGAGCRYPAHLPRRTNATDEFSLSVACSTSSMGETGAVQHRYATRCAPEDTTAES